jgi:hypothetical protein
MQSSRAGVLLNESPVQARSTSNPAFPFMPYPALKPRRLEIPTEAKMRQLGLGETLVSLTVRYRSNLTA